MFSSINYDQDISDDESMHSMYDDVLFNHAILPNDEYVPETRGWEAMNGNENAITHFNLGTETDDDDDDDSVNSIYDTLLQSSSKEESSAPNHTMSDSRRWESFQTGANSYDSDDLLSLGSAGLLSEDDDDESGQSMEDNIFQHQVVNFKTAARICSRRKMFNRKMFNSNRWESFATGLGSYDSADLLSSDGSCDDDLSLVSEDESIERGFSGSFSPSNNQNTNRKSLRIPSRMQTPHATFTSTRTTVVCHKVAKTTVV